MCKKLLYMLCLLLDEFPRRRITGATVNNAVNTIRLQCSCVCQGNVPCSKKEINFAVHTNVKIIWFSTAPLTQYGLRMMAFDWLIAEACGGTHRHRSLQATWKRRSIQLLVTVTQNHHVGNHPIHTLWEVMNMENGELLCCCCFSFLPFPL